MEENQNNTQIEAGKESCCDHCGKKINCWKCVFLVVLLFLTLSLAYAGYQFSQKLTPLPLPTPTSVAQPSSTPTPDPTANWKTFTSPTFGLSFKYPSDWKWEVPNSAGKDDPNGNFQSIIVVRPISISEAKNENLPLVGGFITIEIRKGAETLPSDLKTDKTVRITDLLIVNRKATEYWLPIDPKKSLLTAKSITYLSIETNKEVFVVILLDDTYKNTFNQILSTFKFLE